MSWKSKLFALLIVVLAATLSVFLVKTKPVAQSQVWSGRELAVDTVTLNKQDVSPYIKLTGRLEPVRTTELRFEVAGQVLERLVELGQSVQTSQTLFVVDSRDYRDVMAQAQAEFDIIQLGIERDRALLDLAKQKIVLQIAEVKRFAGLDQQMLSSRSQLEAAEQKLLQLRTEQVELENAIAISQARLQINRAKLQLAQRNLLRTRLLAPYSGVVNAVHAELGDYVNIGQLALQLVDVSAFHFLVNVTGDVAAALRIGDAVELQVQQRKYQARVIAVQQVPDTDTYSHEVLIRVAGEGLYAAMTGRVALPRATQKDVFVVPKTALYYADGRSYLFIVDQQRLLRRVEVTTAARLDDQVVVRGDLQAGQMLVARGVSSLYSGVSVVVRSTEH